MFTAAAVCAWSPTTYSIDRCPDGVYRERCDGIERPPLRYTSEPVSERQQRAEARRATDRKAAKNVEKAKQKYQEAVTEGNRKNKESAQQMNERNQRMNQAAQR